MLDLSSIVIRLFGSKQTDLRYEKITNGDERKANIPLFHPKVPSHARLQLNRVWTLLGSL